MYNEKVYEDDASNISEDEINKRADDLAKKLYDDNKAIIDDITDEEKETLGEQYNQEKGTVQKKKKSKSKVLWILFGLAAMVLILILIVSNIMSLANGIPNKYLKIAFYVLIGILCVILIIAPLTEIMFLPSYKSLFAIEEKGKKEKVVANVKKILLIVRRHEKEWNIDSLSIKTKEKYATALKALKTSNDKDELVKSYHYIYRNFIKKDIMNIITKYSNKVFLATAVVQNGKVDSLLLFSTYLKMSKDILKYCGYRISFVRLCKLMIHVLSMLAAATKLQQIDFSALFPKMMMNQLGKIPGAKTVVNSLGDGVSNALIFYKTGVMLEEYLLSDNQSLVHQWGVAIKETAKYMLVGLIGEIIKKIAEFTTLALKKTLQGIKNFFVTIQNQISYKKENKKLIPAK